MFDCILHSHRKYLKNKHIRYVYLLCLELGLFQALGFAHIWCSINLFFLPSEERDGLSFTLFSPDNTGKYKLRSLLIWSVLVVNKMFNKSNYVDCAQT